MPEQLKELIEKIQQEGVKAAEEKASAIEAQARRQAQDIIEKARREAQELMAQAKNKAAQTEESTKASLKQAGRDLLLALKTEINEMLNKIIKAQVREALGPEEMAQILVSLIKSYGMQEKGDVIVSLRKEDAEKLEKGFLGELKKQTQKGIVLRSCDDIHAGFTISYDAGRSYFDFTDKALSEYISVSLKPRLAEILGETTRK